MVNVTMIEPCCAERQTGSWLRENKGHAVMLQTQGDVTLKKWMQAVMLMAGALRPRTLTLAISEPMAKDTEAVLAKHLALGWVEHLTLLTREALTAEDVQRLAQRCEWTPERLLEHVTLASDETYRSDVMIFAGQDGTVVIQGPMVAKPTKVLTLYAGLYGKQDAPAVRQAVAPIMAFIRARKYDVALTETPLSSPEGEE